MNKKMLILSIYPAPYRVELFNQFKDFNADIFFEFSNGDEREKDWFSKGNYALLDTNEGRQTYKKAIKNLKKYSLVAIYDYSTGASIKLILNCMRKHIPYVVNSDGVMLTDHSNFIKKIIKKFLLKKSICIFSKWRKCKAIFYKLRCKRKKHLHS